MASSTTKPYSAILTAFDSLGKQVLDIILTENEAAGTSGEDLSASTASNPQSAPAVAVATNQQSQLHDAMMQCLQLEGAMLCKLVPSFATFTQQQQPDCTEHDEHQHQHQRQQEGQEKQEHSEHGPEHQSSSSGVLVSERLALSVRFFLREFTKSIAPLAIFLDDLQWSDPYSKELISAVAEDNDLTGFLLLGAFRDEEPEQIQLFITLGTRLKTDSDTERSVVLDVPLQDLSLGNVNAYVASILTSSSDKQEATKPLAELLHRKTNGNPFFVNLLLQQMHAAGYLQYNFATLEWEWDMNQATVGTDIAGNLLETVTQRLLLVPNHVQKLLQMAACLGFYVDIELLRRLAVEGLLKRLFFADNSGPLNKNGPRQTLSIQSSISFDDVWFEEALRTAQEEALVEKVGNCLKFSHDQIRQAAYNMIEGSVRDTVHYEIGQFLQTIDEEEQTKRNARALLCATSFDSQPLMASTRGAAPSLFLAVDQLNRGSKIVENGEGRIPLIKLNYEAAQRARERSEVEASALFLHKAVELAKQEDWLYHYELILDIYNSAVEEYFSLGKVDETKETLHIIYENSVRELDKVRAMAIEYSLLGSLCLFKEAIALGCKVLRLLGEKVPKKVSLMHVAWEYIRASSEAKGKTDEFFTGLSPVDTKHGALKQKILEVGSVFGWNGDVNFSGFAMLRGFRISMKEGKCASTPFLFSGYGFMLSMFGKYEEAYRFGQLALRTGKAKATFPSSIMLTYSGLTHLQLPVAVALEPYLSGYRIGLETGDLFMGCICVSTYTYVYINCGLPLEPFEEDLRNFSEQLRFCHQDLALAWLLPAHQLALNLMGRTSNPADLSREAIERHHAHLLSKNQLTWVEGGRVVKAEILFLWYLQLFNAYVMQDDEVARKALSRIRSLKKEARRFGGTHGFHYFMAVVDGLVGLWLESSGSRVSGLTKAALAELSKRKNVNSVTLLKLLKTEIAGRKKSISADVARRGYDQVISEFSKTGMNHLAAISNELAGKCMLVKQETDWGKLYLERAMQRWSMYSAFAKVDLMTKQYGFLSAAASNLSKLERGSLVQGRSRFDMLTDSVVAGPPSHEFSGSMSFQLRKEE